MLHFSKWLCLVHGQFAMSLRHVKRLVICKCLFNMYLSLWYSAMVSFIISTILSVTEIPHRRDSAKCQLVRLYSQFHSPKCYKHYRSQYLQYFGRTSHEILTLPRITFTAIHSNSRSQQFHRYKTFKWFKTPFKCKRYKDII